ncbi:MAG: acyl carrier protein [bacterium]
MDIRTNLRDFIVDSFLLGRDPEELSDSSSLLDLGVIDSTGVLELVGHLEATFAITVEDDELIPDNLDTINNLVRFVEGKQGG